jgi:AraC-like DNA-binding protein
MLRMCANSAPERERPNLLGEFFHRLGVRYDTQAVDGDPVEIDLTLQALPGLQIMSGRLQGARNRRTRGNNDATEDIGLIINLKGTQVLAQRGREIVLHDGEAALVSCSDALDTVHRPPGDLLSLRLLRPEIAPRLAAQDCFMRRIPGGTPALGLLTRYVNVLTHDATSADRGLQGTIASHVYDLAALALGATRDAAEQATGQGLRAARLFTIKQDIARSLARPDLSIDELARRHGCTPRYIQRLMESEGTSFTEYLLAQRLAHAHRMLTDPHRRGEKISMIALDSGFGDLSYFNRTFRRRYGDTPSAFRVLARQAVDQA